jgi:K+-sensing histidine kinase KdpD
VVKDFIDTARTDPWLRIAMVVALVNLTNGLNVALYKPHGQLSFALYWFDVGVLSWALGPLAGAMTTGLSVLSVWFFLIPPVFSFHLRSQAEFETLYEFGAIALLVYGSICACLRLARRRQAT